MWLGMITERREILFETEALLLVLANSPRAVAAFGLPPGLPQAVVFEPTRDSVRFVWSGGPRRSAELKAAELGALLVGFCLRLRVPLPRRATKTIRVEPGAVVLAFRNTVKPNALALLPEGHQPGQDLAPTERKWDAG